MSSGGIPEIPAGTGTGSGDLDAVFDKSLGDFDGVMESEREVIAATGGGSAKAAGRREQGDADAVANSAGGMVDSGSDDGMGAGGAGPQGTVGQAGTGVPGSNGPQGTGGQSGTGDQGAEGSMGKTGQPGSGSGEDSGSNGKAAVKLPDDIPVDGSGDDVVGRQIREAAIAMQETNPQAAEKLWDEYRKHTGIK